MTQTAAAQREAEQQRAAVAAEAAAGIAVVEEPEEEEEEEIDDSAPIAPQPRAGRAATEEELEPGMAGRAPISEDGEILGGELPEEEPVDAVEEEVEEEGYTLEDEDELELETEEEEETPITPTDEEF
ncbi:MAG: hypothetical protein JO101_09515 [Candidatus Eremiobacteraeota bacterium]|nr:hypothetical protein [Candidatus Eremiobacteraeota bacterium]